jgi:putative ABC transport system permease protein
MNSLDVINMGLRNMWRRKTRTILTVLGVIIGTSSIVIMLSLGIGMNENFKREIERMGSLNIINIDANYIPPDMGRRGVGVKQEVTLDDKTLATIGTIDGVEAVTPIMYSHWKFGVGKLIGSFSVIGIDTKVMEKFNFEVEEGRLLNESDTGALVFGCYLPDWFYNPKARYYYGGPTSRPNLISDKIIMTMNMDYGEKRRSGPRDGGDKPAPEYKVKGVGILKQSNDDKDYNAYMNISHLKKIIEESNKAQGRQGRGFDLYSQTSKDGYQNAMVKVKDIKNVKKIQDKIKEMGFGAFSLTDILDSMQKTSAGIQAILGGIGAVSLLVAAIGIANTMIMSIYERTREIGVMKVLGAELSDIKRLFLFEAGLIGFAGGVVGIGFSLLISFILNNAGLSLFMNFFGPMGDGSKISVIPLWLMLSSVVFATLIGLISGYYPARRAMKLSALEAIKTE